VGPSAQGGGVAARGTVAEALPPESRGQGTRAEGGRRRHGAGARPPDIGARHPGYTVARAREKGRRRAGERRYGKKRKVHCNHFPILVHVKLRSQTG